MGMEYFNNGDGMNAETLGQQQPQQQQQLILCCKCGITIPPNPANMCVNCVRGEVDITEGIPKQIIANWCKNCERYLQPPNSWIVAAPESKELMALLLRKIKLNKVRLVDASFIWTEPHSRRIRMKLTIQKEVFAGTILQQVFQVEVVVSSMQCPDCDRVMAQNMWRAAVQVRQRGVAHKKTFFFLEQVILKHQAHRDTVNIKECKDGLDFYFAQRQHALQFLSFLQSVVPCRQQQSQQLISTDIRSNNANFKYTISVEILPICKDDLIVLPIKLAKKIGNINPLVLCTRVRGGGVSVMDVRTLQTAEVQANEYWRSPFTALCEAGAGGLGGGLMTYYIIDVEPLHGTGRGKMMLADVTVARCVKPYGAADNTPIEEYDIDMDQTFITRTHLGNLLHAGDYAQGYHLHSSNFNSVLFDELQQSIQNSSSGYHEVPDVVLLRKVFPGRRSRGKQRHWRVKRLAEGMEVEMDEELQRTANKRTEQEKRELEWEGFLRELEEDKEMRDMVNLYRDPTVPVPMQEGEMPDVDLSELLEDLAIQD